MFFNGIKQSIENLRYNKEKKLKAADFFHIKTLYLFVE